MLVCLLSFDTYQIRHPWHWLTYGQNSSALQTVAAVVAAIAAIFAGFYAARAYRAANQQVELVREQLTEQRNENAAAASRYNDEKTRVEQEREEAKAKARAQYRQMIVDEDASRPRFKNRSSYSRTHGQSLSFENYGGTPAENVRFTSPVTDKLIVQRGYVKPGEQCSGTFDAAEMEQVGVFITFRNHRGTEWTVRYYLNSATGSDEVVSVHRPWNVTEGDDSEPPIMRV